MAVVYIAEFPGVSQGTGYSGAAPVCDWPPIGKQAVAIGALSAKFSPTTRVIRVTTDAICSIAVSKGPPAAGVTFAATANDARFAAGDKEYLAVTPGSVLSSITNT